MPRYNYECIDCLERVRSKYAGDLAESGDIPIDVLEREVLYETSHSMDPTDEELHASCECPRCGSHNAVRSFHGSEIRSYIRGYGYLDKAGCKRDMNKHALENNDPYSQYRGPGEVEHIKSQLDKGGKHNPNTKYFSMKKSDEK